MRGYALACCVVLLSLTAMASPSDSSQPKTIEGCIAGMNGAFRLRTANGETYLLKGDHSTLFTYNGKQVRVTGTVKASAKGSSGAPGTLKVSDIKKVYDTCQF
jgi:hypothetical protein